MRIFIASSTDGSSTHTGWNLLSSAGSFSIYFLYSSIVVAPMVWISPLARKGFMIFAASTAPSAAPAPTIVWSSSMKRITLSFCFSISLSMAFILSSNSPRNFVPAMSPGRSSASTFLFFRTSGTSPFTILWARPSTIAVLPTPASPTSTGLFLVFLASICITLFISFSRFITGSPGSAVISLVYFSSILYLLSASGSSILFSPRTLFNALYIFSLFIPYLLKRTATSPPASVSASRICSEPIYWSVSLRASSHASFNTFCALGVMYACVVP